MYVFSLYSKSGRVILANYRALPLLVNDLIYATPDNIIDFTHSSMDIQFVCI